MQVTSLIGNTRLRANGYRFNSSSVMSTTTITRQIDCHFFCFNKYLHSILPDFGILIVLVLTCLLKDRVTNEHFSEVSVEGRIFCRSYHLITIFIHVHLFLALISFAQRNKIVLSYLSLIFGQLKVECLISKFS